MILAFGWRLKKLPYPRIMQAVWLFVRYQYLYDGKLVYSNDSGPLKYIGVLAFIKGHPCVASRDPLFLVSKLFGLAGHVK